MTQQTIKYLQMKFLKFKNDGIITEEAITLLGASTKRNQKNKIGFFGSGNKFALAYLIRNGYDVRIFGGENEIEVTTIPKKLGDNDFDVICINGRETSITTEFGAKWELWQALREIYSNSIDEGNATIELVNDVEPKEDETHYYISVRAEITEWFGKFNNYFSENKEVLFESKYGRILKKHDNQGHLYRKGISVWHSDKNSLYDYDVNDIKITEDRIVSYSWQIPEKIWKIIYSCTDKEIIKNILYNSVDDMLEGAISDFSDIDASKISDEFKEVLKSMRVCSKNMSGYLKEDEKANTTILPSKIFSSINQYLSDENIGKNFRVGLDGNMYRVVEMNEYHKETLRKIEDFLKEAQYTDLYDYGIVIGVFDNKEIMGFADANEGDIVISNIAFDKGVNYVLEVMIEEYIHLKYDVSDETRSFQDAMISEMVKIMKIKNAYIL